MSGTFRASSVWEHVWAVHSPHVAPTSLEPLAILTHKSGRGGGPISGLQTQKLYISEYGHIVPGKNSPLECELFPSGEANAMRTGTLGGS